MLYSLNFPPHKLGSLTDSKLTTKKVYRAKILNFSVGQKPRQLPNTHFFHFPGGCEIFRRDDKMCIQGSWKQLLKTLQI